MSILVMLPKNDRKIVAIALSKAISWNDSLIDVHTNRWDGSKNKSDAPKCRAWEKENREYRKVLRWINQRACTRKTSSNAKSDREKE